YIIIILKLKTSEFIHDWSRLSLSHAPNDDGLRHFYAETMQAVSGKYEGNVDSTRVIRKLY
ncbi:MAG: hypothetical protein AAGF25_04900, partial [Pseudomonadota bacterium]